jgi:hypothetical protein
MVILSDLIINLPLVFIYSTYAIDKDLYSIKCTSFYAALLVLVP